MKSELNKNDVAKKGKAKKKLTLRQKLIVVLGTILCLLIIVFASAYGVFLHYYNKMNITSPNDDTQIVTAIDYEEDDINESELTEEERQQLEQLFEEANASSEDGDGETKEDEKDKNAGDKKDADTASSDDAASVDTSVITDKTNAPEPIP